MSADELRILPIQLIQQKETAPRSVNARARFCLSSIRRRRSRPRSVSAASTADQTDQTSRRQSIVIRSQRCCAGQLSTVYSLRFAILMRLKMARTPLLNPFALSTSESLPSQRSAHKPQSSRTAPVCSKCKSEDIITNAVAQWSNEAQEWQLADTFDKEGYCHNCHAPCEIVWLPFN